MEREKICIECRAETGKKVETDYAYEVKYLRYECQECGEAWYVRRYENKGEISK